MMGNIYSQSKVNPPSEAGDSSGVKSTGKSKKKVSFLFVAENSKAQDSEDNSQEISQKEDPQPISKSHDSQSSEDEPMISENDR